MELYNETLLGSYLAHIQANVRRLAALDFERAHHPDNIPATMSEVRREMMELWETLSRQLFELLCLKLKPFLELAGPGPFHSHVNEEQGMRVLRWNLGKLKKMADRHRRKNPGFTLLESWDYQARKQTRYN